MTSKPKMDIRLTPDALNLEKTAEWVMELEAGGIVLFAGTTRAETHPEFGELLHLEYDAHAPMATKEMTAIGEEACARWPVIRAMLHHRVGIVSVGQPSVIIAVSCAHRDEAYRTSRYLIDELKKRVPIWKKERYSAHAQWQKDV